MIVEHDHRLFYGSIISNLKSMKEIQKERTTYFIDPFVNVLGQKVTLKDIQDGTMTNACLYAELYLIGIQTFEKTMKQREKNELISLMMEKEIRLRHPIEDDLLA